ncbi:MAG: DUF5682 family protein [Ktedonobacterales bacterium]
MPDEHAEILYFPIRHHSPACAWHVQQVIAERRPHAILIEGPRDATPLIAHLSLPATHAPVAIYTTFVDTANQLGRTAAVTSDTVGQTSGKSSKSARSSKSDKSSASRFAAYYPLADYSPEFVAIRAGTTTGAAVRFIDLTFPEMVIAERGAASEDENSDQKRSPQARSLLDESYLRHSSYLKALCEKTGARDPDDLWDHLYETDFLTVETDEFLRRVETYCALSRADHSEETLAAEGHLAREAAMAREIAAEVANGPGLVLVVTGGFHTPALRERVTALLAQAPQSEAMQGGKKSGKRQTSEPQAIPGEAQTLLMRYGFAQLDRLNGYGSGMPAPAYYQRIWERLQQHPDDAAPVARVAAEVIVELGRLTRARGQGLSPADEIAALDLTCRLARFRNHAQPTREDMLDGIRSACVKGTADAEGAELLARVRKLLMGDMIGDLPPNVGVAPLVDDFRRSAAQHRLDISSLQPREAKLDIYKSVGHRAASRFFYRLDYLGIPFAKRTKGPDFVKGRDLAYMQEEWRYQWAPSVETTLTEQSLYGATLEEAAANLLQEKLSEDEDQGVGRRADVAASHLLNACRMGLQRFAPELLTRTAGLVAEDASVASLTRAADALVLLHRSREPLEAHNLSGVMEVARTAYIRACYLLPDLGNTPDEEEVATLDALNALPQVALSLDDDAMLHALRHDGLRALLANSQPGKGAAICGAGAGALYADGELTEDELITYVTGRLDLDGVAFLRGLLRTNRSIVWQSRQLLTALNATFCAWSSDRFIRQLPELRLAFSDLTARECDVVARNVAELVGATAVPSLVVAGATPDDLLLGATLDERLRATLERDGLLDVFVTVAR